MVRSRVHLSVALALLMVQISCGDGTVDPTGGKATLAISVNLSGTMVAMVVADVSAPDIPTMLVFNIPIANGVAAGTITVPAGSNRTITLRAYDAGGIETHTGSVTVTIQAGTNPTMAIVLTPLTGNVPITATLGSFIVTVTQPQPPVPLSVAGTVQLTATIRDSNGNPPSGNIVITWATRNPGVATVDGVGLVTATGVGSTTISAVYQGVAGNATITVAP
jgi:Bacterial Ig-like domain (group 2)